MPTAGDPRVQLMQSIPVSIACSLMLSGLNERQSTVSTDVATVLPSRLFDYMIK